MTDPGLNQRLRQRSRRAGFMIGISMALTIAVLVAGFSVIYAALDGTVGDFISRDVPDPIIPTTEPTEQTIAQTDDDPASNPDPDPDEAVEPETEPTPVPEEADEPTEESDDFDPDYLSHPTEDLNFRTEPSTSGGLSTVIRVLPVGTLLQFTGETQASDDPDVDGADGWMFFEIEDGTEGWLRAIDVNEYEP